MTLGTKRFDLARFGSEKSSTFARQNARVVYTIITEIAENPKKSRQN